MLALLIPGVGMGAGTAPVLVEVPDVVGETQAAGTTTLEGEGFVVSVSTAYSSTVAAGLIISQDPEGGEFAASGSTVEIVVSLGPEPEPPAPEQPEGGDDAWKYQGPLPKQKDYRPDLDEKRLKERQELRELIERAAGLIDEAQEQVAEAGSPMALEPQTAALSVEFGKLRDYAEAIEYEPDLDLAAAQANVDALIARAVDGLIVQIADVLTDLIQEIADEDD